MARFSYDAIDRRGARIQGELDAPTRSDAFRQLGTQRLQPLRLELAENGSKNGSKNSHARSAAESDNLPTNIRLSRSQVILFTDELSELLDAGLQIESALRVMADRKELSRLKTLAAVLRRSVREGRPLSAALRSTSPSFGAVYCNLVAAGEMSGSLPQLLKRQAAFLVAIDEIQKKVVAALIYPALIAVLGIGLVFLFMTYLVPQMTILFEKTGKELPFVTRMLVDVSGFFSQYWWALLLGIGVVILAAWRFVKSPYGRRWWDRTQLRLPLIGPLLRGRFFAQFAQTLANLVTNGVPLLSALRLITDATLNKHWHTALAKITDSVGEGISFSRSLQRAGDFPSLFVDMVIVGEQTGDLARALAKSAAKFDKELTLRIERLTALIQPVVILVMAGMVGLVAYSIINGIFDAVSGLQVR
ncbi:MAG: type II secretion system F family protein [Verrucomicrobia bacterium]|nr:type II secretion system F family protein [Verrucomicrobiota bacterium]